MNNYREEDLVINNIEELQLQLFDDDRHFDVLINKPAVSPQPYRPLQYLGAKGRAITHILNQVDHYEIGDKFVMDAFSGSSVVSQSLAQAGYNVVANDSLSFCAEIAKAFLNVDRILESERDLSAVIGLLETHTTPSQHYWNNLVAQEKELLEVSDSAKLSLFYQSIPTIWRLDKVTKELNQFFNSISPDQSAGLDGGLVASYYAGTYFGVSQAVDIDRIRHGIFYLRETKQITQWQNSLLLTALISVMSKTVHSAGKHFAQAISLKRSDRAMILRKRLLQDRCLNVWSLFQKSIGELVHTPTCTSFMSAQKHKVLNISTELIDKQYLPSIGAIYADPPYTAQQYSRFYHIPEVVFRYEYPSLQEVNDQVTNGLYPDDKFKSSFCSKTAAPNSFQKLFELSRELNAHLLISYSFSLSGITGNSRMISMEQILELGRYYFGKNSETISQLQFSYRQLNSKKSAVSKRKDKEFLISFLACDK